MTSSPAKVALAVCGASLVVYMVMGAVGRKSPGPVTAVHAAIDALDGGQSCASCHGGWTRDMTQSCLACHAPIAEQLERGRGVHGIAGRERVAQCARCHSEHHGANFAIVSARSFALAGTAGPEAFDHGFVGWEMAGAHLALECSQCHEHADAPVLADGQRRYLGLERDCASCHESEHREAHGGAMTMSCAACHVQDTFEQILAPDHDRHLDLAGGHADLRCAACHTPDTEHAIEALGVGARPRARRCADCHETPHDAGFLDGIASLSGVDAAAGCSGCHDPVGHATFGQDRASVTTEQHAASGFALTAPHDRADCAQCHVGTTFEARHARRAADDCRACHDDPHAGQFDDGPFVEQGCLGCHERQHFAPHAFSVDDHVATAFALTGAHAATECRGCHTDPAKGAPRRFDGTPARCEACHADAHDGFFAPRLAAVERGAEGSCAQCHGTTAFGAASAAFDHERWTGFALSGSHGQAECEACHARAPEPDRLGRRFGRVAAQFGTSTGCASCHADPHGGAFDAVEPVVDGRQGCARCHVPDSFRALPHGFDHARWTGFELRGRHRDAACSACHAPLARPDPRDGRTGSRAPGTTCIACHTDPHAGQFASSAGGNDCSRCHSARAPGFSELRFDHDRDARFKLGPAHADVSCDRCHSTVVTGTRDVVRYRPLGRQCSDCHGDARDPLRRGSKRR